MTTEVNGCDRLEEAAGTEEADAVALEEVRHVDP